MKSTAVMKWTTSFLLFALLAAPAPFKTCVPAHAQDMAEGDDAPADPDGGDAPVDGNQYEKDKEAFKNKPKYIEENPGAKVEGQSLAVMEWSDDQGKTWHAGSGKDAQLVPRTSTNYTIGFRVRRSNPELHWPDTPFRPIWRVSKFGIPAETFIGDEIWVMFEQVAPPGELNGGISAVCGNRITIPVWQVVRDED